MPQRLPRLPTLSFSASSCERPEDRWARIEVQFAYALTLTGDQRRAYLASRCAEDPDLCNELKSLLASDDKAEHNAFLGEPVARLSQAQR